MPEPDPAVFVERAVAAWHESACSFIEHTSVLLGSTTAYLSKAASTSEGIKSSMVFFKEITGPTIGNRSEASLSIEEVLPMLQRALDAIETVNKLCRADDEKEES